MLMQSADIARTGSFYKRQYSVYLAFIYVMCTKILNRESLQ